jgi:hypothetical protein
LPIHRLHQAAARQPFGIKLGQIVEGEEEFWIDGQERFVGVASDIVMFQLLVNRRELHQNLKTGTSLFLSVNAVSFTCKIKPGDNAVGIAGQLTLEIRQMMRGENGPGAVKGFGRQLDYPKSGIA